MKKWLILIFGIILFLVIIGIGYYIWDNSESVIRKRIQNAYYEEMSYEMCELNNHAGFPSNSGCLISVECISKELSKVIRKENLNELNKEIKAKRIIEVLASQYASLGSGDITAICLTPNGYNESLK